MILLFIKQHKSWLAFITLFQLVLNLIIAVDLGLLGVSLFYINAIWLVLVVVFLIILYVCERKVMQQYEISRPNYVEAVKESYEQLLLEKKVEIQEQKLQLLERQDELLAWVHEMKSPMTALQLLIEQMERYDMKERFEAEWLRLYLLLDQQLHATRLLTIEQDNRLEPVQLQSIIVPEIQALRSWCFDKQIAIELGDIEREVITDSKWLGFIVRQILSNAVKYSHVGGEVALNVTTENDQLAIVIQDNGIGIKKEDLPRVFRKSYTGTIGRETSAATGMGLYLAKQAADSLHIKLLIDSTEGVGTSVTIRFPKENNYEKTLR